MTRNDIVTPITLQGQQRQQGQQVYMSLSSLQGQRRPLRFAESVPETGHTSYGDSNP